MFWYTHLTHGLEPFSSMSQKWKITFIFTLIALMIIACLCYKVNTWNKNMNFFSQIFSIKKKTFICKAVEEYTAEDVELVMELAEKDDPVAQYVVGLLYEHGIHLEVDIDKAIQWWSKAADGGNKDAQETMGGVYADGQYRPIDYEKAFLYYKKAAEQGQPYALFNLGLMYEHAQFVEQNYQKACEYYEKAAQNGLAIAQLYLADMYFSGLGVQRDIALACSLYKESLKKRNTFPEGTDIVRILDTLGAIYRLQDVKEEELSKAEAIAYLKESYQEGGRRSEALISLAIIAEKIGLDLKTLQWLKQTCENDMEDPRALFALGVLHEFGLIFPQDNTQAFNYYQKSAQFGEPWGMHYLAALYFTGKGVEENLSEGFQWTLKAAEAGLSGAYLNVGIGYLFGLGVEPNRTEALRWLKCAADCGVSEAIELLQKNFEESE